MVNILQKECRPAVHGRTTLSSKLSSSLAFKKRFICQIGAVRIGFGHKFERGMHAEHRYAAVDDVTTPVGHNIGDRSAAALVHLAELAGLPRHAGGIENLPDFR